MCCFICQGCPNVSKVTQLIFPFFYNIFKIQIRHIKEVTLKNFILSSAEMNIMENRVVSSVLCAPGCSLWAWPWRSCWCHLRSKTAWLLASMNLRNFSMCELKALKACLRVCFVIFELHSYEYVFTLYCSISQACECKFFLLLFFRDPDSVVLCVLAADHEEDVALQIHFTLLQSFCCNSGITILQVSGIQRLHQLLGAADVNKDQDERKDLHCLLVTVCLFRKWAFILK